MADDSGCFLGAYDDALLREFMVPMGAASTEADVQVTTQVTTPDDTCSSSNIPAPLAAQPAESEVYSWLEGCTPLPVQPVQQLQQPQLQQQPQPQQQPPTTADSASTTLQPAAPLIPPTSTTDPEDVADGPPPGVDMAAWLAAGASDDELDSLQPSQQQLQPVKQKLQPKRKVRKPQPRKPHSSTAPQHSWLNVSSGDSSNQMQPLQPLQQAQQQLQPATHHTSPTLHVDFEPPAYLMPTSSVLPRIKVEESDFDVPSWLTGSSGSVPQQLQLQQSQLTTQHSLAIHQPAAPLMATCSTALSVKKEEQESDAMGTSPWLSGSSAVSSNPVQHSQQMQQFQQLQPLRPAPATLQTPHHLRPPLPIGAAPPAKRFAGELDVNGRYWPPPAGVATCSTGQMQQQLQPHQNLQLMQQQQLAARHAHMTLQRPPAAPFTGNFAPPMAQRPQPRGPYNTTNYYGNYNYNQAYGVAAGNVSMPSPIGLPSSSFTPIGKPAAFPPFTQNYIPNPLPRLPPVNQPLYPSGVSGALPPVTTLRPNPMLRPPLLVYNPLAPAPSSLLPSSTPLTCPPCSYQSGSRFAVPPMQNCVVSQGGFYPPPPMLPYPKQAGLAVAPNNMMSTALPGFSQRNPATVSPMLPKKKTRGGSEQSRNPIIVPGSTRVVPQSSVRGPFPIVKEEIRSQSTLNPYPANASQPGVAVGGFIAPAPTTLQQLQPPPAFSAAPVAPTDAQLMVPEQSHVTGTSIADRMDGVAAAAAAPTTLLPITHVKEEMFDSVEDSSQATTRSPSAFESELDDNRAAPSSPSSATSALHSSLACFDSDQRKVLMGLMGTLTQMTGGVGKGERKKADKVVGTCRFDKESVDRLKAPVIFRYPGVDGDIEFDLAAAMAEYTQGVRPSQTSLQNFARNVVMKVADLPNAAQFVTAGCEKSTRGFPILAESSLRTLAKFWLDHFRPEFSPSLHQVADLMTETVKNYLDKRRSTNGRPEK